MNQTGIVRRVDELGRIAIPKDVRRTLRIRDGDPLELFVDNGCVVWKPYVPIGDADPMTLATFIAHNFHHCPIPSCESIQDCAGWYADAKHCADCILRHAHLLGDGEEV